MSAITLLQIFCKIILIFQAIVKDNKFKILINSFCLVEVASLTHLQIASKLRNISSKIRLKVFVHVWSKISFKYILIITLFVRPHVQLRYEWVEVLVQHGKAVIWFYLICIWDVSEL